MYEFIYRNNQLHCWYIEAEAEYNEILIWSKEMSLEEARQIYKDVHVYE